MQYHSQQFTQIAEAAAAHIRPLILQTIKNLATDFRAQFPEVKRIRDHFGTPQIVTKTYILIEADKKNKYTTPFTLFLLDVGIPLTITLQPEILVDGVPIEEAIHNAHATTFVVQSHNYRNWDGSDSDQPNTQTHYVGNDEAKAMAAVRPDGDGVLWTTSKWKDGTQLFFNP